jgi:uncharacterized protein YggL (DUF469 family)
MSNQYRVNRVSKNKLAEHVENWVNEQKEDYDSIEGVFNDLFYGGCQSGIVTHLIYYSDTQKFYKRYKQSIAKLLQDTMNDTGLNVAELFGDKWDNTDPLVLETNNQNLLAWFGFEETARQLANELQIEV